MNKPKIMIGEWQGFRAIIAVMRTSGSANFCYIMKCLTSPMSYNTKDEISLIKNKKDDGHWILDLNQRGRKITKPTKKQKALGLKIWNNFIERIVENEI